MKPVAIIRHSSTEGPAYFATFLDRRNIPWQLVKLDEGEPVPADARAFSGLGFMGGPMSVNDTLPWISPVVELIRNAMRADVPVIGHCLGGQLMSKALGGVVSRNPVKEIGWGQIELLPGAESRRWLGEGVSFESFHWHGETFTIPPHAVRIAASGYCANQMFALGKHIAMQCHIEMTAELIATWCRDWSEELQLLAQHTPSVQTPRQMQTDMDTKVAELHRVADSIYSEWLKGLSPGG